MSGLPSIIVNEADAVVLDSDALIEVMEIDGERASLLDAAANAITAAYLTGTHGVVAMPLDRAAVTFPAPRDIAGPEATWEEAEGESESTALLRARVAALAGSDDPVAHMRAQLELAYARLDEGDLEGARTCATAAQSAVAHAPAVRALMRLLASGREQSSIEEQLGHVDYIATHVSDALVRADFLAEKGRLLEARSGASVESAAAYTEALALVPDHAGALAGLDAALEATGRWSELAALLGRLAGLAGDPAASAWFHVERALLFDRRLGDAGTARSTLDHALELAPKIGPVRRACLDHATVHREDARIGALLESEAALETDPARATCLELDGALAHLRAGDVARATKLLEHAHARGRTSTLVDARVSSELARLLEDAGRHADVLRVRKAALATVAGPRVEVLALRGVAAAAERAGELADAILAVERARVLDAEDETLLQELDRLLVAAQRHDARAVLWTREAALADDTKTKIRALLNAAAASAAADRPVDAARHREAAWITDPSAPGVFDSLVERLAAPGTEEAALARAEAYEKAAAATSDVGRRLHYLEKIAWIWDDLAGDPVRAAQAYEDVLAVDGKRRSAIAGLASAAERARDGRKLARALLAEADVIEGADAKNEVRLRAAEALADVEPERSLALAEELSKVAHLAHAMRARQLVTRLHAGAGRWELMAMSLGERAAAETKPRGKLALVLAQAAVLAQRLSAPQRALATLEAARDVAPGDPAIASSIVDALEAMGNEVALRKQLEMLAREAPDADTRAAYFVRAAEIAERQTGGDDEAVRLYLQARDALPKERLVLERLTRLGARTAVPADLASPLLAAVRALDAGRPAEGVTAETLLALPSPDFATLRMAERLARVARSGPQLANALALIADTTNATLASRALSALAAVVAWMLPTSEELGPWDRLVAMGARDAVVLDDFLRRARPKIAAGDARALSLSIAALRRRIEAAADGTEGSVLRIELARLERRAGALKDATEACREALAIDAASVGAAALLAKVATDNGDRRGAILAAKTLADVVRSLGARAALLRDAADLSAAEGEKKEAALLFESALEADPDAVLVAARLAQIQSDAGAWADLARVLKRGLAAARTTEAIVPMAAELASVAKTQLQNPLMAIEALERSRAVAPGHIPALFLLAELYIGQRTWEEALRALGDVVKQSAEKSEKLVALVGRASILSRVLDRSEDAQTELRAALTLDPHELRALRAILALPLKRENAERADLLSRLVVAETQPRERLAALLALSKVRAELGDRPGVEGALVEAAALSPDAIMLDRLREASAGKPENAARIIGRAISRIREAGVVPAAEWLVTLGEIELSLRRFDSAIESFEGALELEPYREGARVALARALLGGKRYDDAAATLMTLLEVPGASLLDVGFVRQLEEAFNGAGRTHQAMAARELRSLAGDLDEAGVAALRARRPAFAEGEPLSGTMLRKFVMPGGLGQHPLWDAASLTEGIAGKLGRLSLADQGSSTRERIKPRAVHPVRQMFDRMLRLFDLSGIELAASDHAVMPLVACEDETWVIVPSGIVDWPEGLATAALARPLARIALGVPWLGALPPDETMAIIIAFARQAAPSAGAMPRERIEALVADYDLRARKAIDRKKRKMLEDIEAPLTRAPLMPIDAFVDAALRTEARASFLASGDLRAALDALAATEPGRAGFGAVLARPLSRDLVAYAMGSEAVGLRRTIGTLWG